MKNIVQEVTDGCIRDDCSIVGADQCTTTSAYHPIVYDKNGVPKERVSPEIVQNLECLTCGKMWMVTTTHKQDRLIEHLPSVKGDK